MNSGMWDWTIGRADRAADEEAQESKSLFYKQPIIKRYQKISNPLQHLRVNGWMLKHHGAVTSDLSNPYHRSWEFQTQYQTLRPYQTISDHQDRNEIETSLDSHGFGLSWQSCVENIGKLQHEYYELRRSTLNSSHLLSSFFVEPRELVQVPDQCIHINIIITLIRRYSWYVKISGKHIIM